MNYIEWVEQVAVVFARVATGHDRIIGIDELRAEMAVPPEAIDAVHTAVQDLDALGIVELDSVQWVKPTQNTRALRSGAALREVWPAIVGQFLDEEQAAFMTRLTELAHRPGEQFADVEWTRIQDVYERLDWRIEDHEPYALTESLERLGCGDC